MTQTPEQIARGLTKAQREFLLLLPELKGEKFAPGLKLEQLGLAYCLIEKNRYPRWMITPLGQQIRTIFATGRIGKSDA